MLRPIEKLRKVSLDSWLMMSVGVFLMLLIVQALRYGTAGELGGNIAQAPPALAEPLTREEAKSLEEYQVIAEKGHFGKLEKKKEPPKPKLFGVLGEFAFIGNSAQDAKPYAIGAEVPGGAKLLEIHPNSVVLEKDGKRQTLAVFPELTGGKAEGQPGPPEPAAPDKGRKPEEKPAPTAGAAEVEPEAPAEAEEEGPTDAEKERRAKERLAEMIKIRISRERGGRVANTLP